MTTTNNDDREFIRKSMEIYLNTLKKELGDRVQRELGLRSVVEFDGGGFDGDVYITIFGGDYRSQKFQDFISSLNNDERYKHLVVGIILQNQEDPEGVNI